MKSAVRFSKLEYANKYDSHADSLYRFALCVTGDRRIAGTAMAQLFSEGYFSCEAENFETHMLKVLWRILQSCPYGTEEAYRQNMKALLPDESQQRMIEKLSHLSPKERAQTMLGTLFQRGDDAVAGILAHRPQDEGEHYYLFGNRLSFAAS